MSNESEISSQYCISWACFDQFKDIMENNQNLIATMHDVHTNCLKTQENVNSEHQDISTCSNCKI